MSEFVVDLSTYKPNVGDRVQPGIHQAIVEDIADDTTKAGGRMLIAWLRIVGGPNDGSTIIDRFTYLDEKGQPSKALFRLVNFMQALGIPTPKKRISLSPALFLNKSVEIEAVDGDPYKGKVRSEVSVYSKSGASAGGAAPAAPVEDWTALATAGLPAATPAPAQPAPAPAAVEQPSQPAQPALDAMTPATITPAPINPAPINPAPVPAVAPAPGPIDLDSIDIN